VSYPRGCKSNRISTCAKDIYIFVLDLSNHLYASVHSKRETREDDTNSVGVQSDAGDEGFSPWVLCFFCFFFKKTFSKRQLLLLECLFSSVASLKSVHVRVVTICTNFLTSDCRISRVFPVTVFFVFLPWDPSCSDI
jgi:hypothetical protein